MVGICWDATAARRKQAEERRLEERLLQAQHLESLQLLAGGVAHDFNNLLTTIVGSLGLAKEELGSEHRVGALLDDAETAARAAATLTMQLLAYSGKGRFVVQALDLSTLARESEELLRSSMPPNVGLHLDLVEDECLVRADETQLRQIVVNLVRNASEAIGDQRGTVTIATRHECVDPDEIDDSSLVHESFGETPGRYAVVEVTDTGCGIASETAERVFEPFFSTKGTGRGLGLAAVMGIVRGHGGSLRVKSSLGRGTSVQVLIPVDGKASDEAEPKQAVARLLVADDHDAVRKTITKMLVKRGFEVLTAADGLEAIELFRVHGDELALALIDLTMPRMSGEEVVEKIRQLDGDIPILLMSGYDAGETSGRFDEFRIAGFLQKPFEAGVLEKTVAAALGLGSSLVGTARIPTS